VRCTKCASEGIDETECEFVSLRCVRARGHFGTVEPNAPNRLPRTRRERSSLRTCRTPAVPPPWLGTHSRAQPVRPRGEDGRVRTRRGSVVGACPPIETIAWNAEITANHTRFAGRAASSRGRHRRGTASAVDTSPVAHASRRPPVWWMMRPRWPAEAADDHTGTAPRRVDRRGSCRREFKVDRSHSDHYRNG